MRGALAVCLGIAIAAGAEARPASKPHELAIFDKDALAEIDQAACAEELARKQHKEPWWLCGYGWRPGFEPGAEKSVASYRLFWVRENAPRIILRIARYADGSGALWLVTEEKAGSGAPPRMQVTTLREFEFAPLFARLDGSELWEPDSFFARLDRDRGEESCRTAARWILEGKRHDDRRAVSVQSCGEGRWVIDLGRDMLRFAKTKIGDLALEGAALDGAH